MKTGMDLLREVERAEARIRAHVRRTPVEPSPWLSAGEVDAHLKLECQQRTGSFKLRGALSKLTALTAAELARGVVTASTGNHGAAVACGARTVGTRALVFAPRSADPVKLEGVRALGAELRVAGDDCVDAEAAARAWAETEGWTYVSPYNDPLVVAGQGTLGLELAQQFERLDALYVSVGGGGLIGGVGGALKALGSELEVVGCSPANSAVLCRSLEAGRIVEEESLPTLSDGTAGGVEADSITFELCAEVIDRFVLVEEDEIAAAMRGVLRHHNATIEGAAGVAVAALSRDRELLAGRTACAVLCGANVAPEVLRRVLAAESESR